MREWSEMAIRDLIRDEIRKMVDSDTMPQKNSTLRRTVDKEGKENDGTN